MQIFKVKSCQTCMYSIDISDVDEMSFAGKMTAINLKCHLLRYMFVLDFA